MERTTRKARAQGPEWLRFETRHVKACSCVDAEIVAPLRSDPERAASLP